MNTIPIIIDKDINENGIEIVRAVYFTIESDSPLPNCTLHYHSSLIPFMMLGLKGIIFAPLVKPISQTDGTFKTAKEFDDLFDAIESDSEFFVSNDEIWIPKILFRTRTKIERASVWRLQDELFRLCLKFTRGDLSFEQIREMKVNNEIYLSETETKAFASWTELVKQESKSIEKNSEDLPDE